jgi:hypothetical protein
MVVGTVMEGLLKLRVASALDRDAVFETHDAAHTSTIIGPNHTKLAFANGWDRS